MPAARPAAAHPGALAVTRTRALTASFALLALWGCGSVPAGGGGNAAPVTAAAPAAAPAPAPAPAAPPPMRFFVTSSNPGKGGDLGGLEGADRHCQALASAVGAGQRTWRAYLSTSDTGRNPSVNARDRIGSGPWHNAKGVLIASSVDELHTSNRIGKDTALTENGHVISGRGDPINTHDILTGSSPAGRALQSEPDATCSNWTSGDVGSAVVGHHDRVGLRDDEASRSWNASHRSRGCSLDALRGTGGGGLFYCFAAD